MSSKIWYDMINWVKPAFLPCFSSDFSNGNPAMALASLPHRPIRFGPALCSPDLSMSWQPAQWSLNILAPIFGSPCGMASSSDGMPNFWYPGLFLCVKITMHRDGEIRMMRKRGRWKMGGKRRGGGEEEEGGGGGEEEEGGGGIKKED